MDLVSLRSFAIARVGVLCGNGRLSKKSAFNKMGTSSKTLSGVNCQDQDQSHDQQDKSPKIGSSLEHSNLSGNPECHPENNS